MDSRELDSMIIDLWPKEAPNSHSWSNIMASAAITFGALIEHLVAATNMPPAAHITASTKLDLVNVDQLASTLTFEKGKVEGDQRVIWTPLLETRVPGYGNLVSSENAPNELDITIKPVLG